MAEAAAAIGRLSRANVSAAEHGTEEGGRGRRGAAAGGLGRDAIRLSLCGVGAVTLHAGPRLLTNTEIGAVGLFTPLRMRRRKKGRFERRNLTGTFCLIVPLTRAPIV